MEGEVDVDLCHLFFSRPRVLAGEKIRGRRREGKHILRGPVNNIPSSRGVDPFGEQVLPSIAVSSGPLSVYET